MRIKGSGHQPLTEQLKKDWAALFLVHPMAFDGLLYLPVDDTEALNPEGEQPTFGMIDDHTKAEAYQSPVPVSLIEVPNDDPMLLTGHDGDSLGMGENELFKCRLSAGTVPDGSVIEYPEIVGDKQISRWWYVHRSTPAPYKHIDAVRIYWCVPFGDLELINAGA
ncbi:MULTISPECIES: hypothetical protein [Pseudoalteromonas]|uniref:hypothetical protein n=1 Tax=Pseudoalteromonas TaxID=53246 RepID=UPI00110A1547|nr:MULTISPECIES: hypothetical protein [Pseudoalteromonas]MCG7545446.1 hypothetical protein [Pseudoalteromonas sp. MM17-2]TMO87715.1 hypothetical protein CWC12_10580 [Pseudoalteromonas ruthenica]TMP21520.1 hypothetical protein CWC06_18405 [Pseudoalteromonas ruthenica]